MAHVIITGESGVIPTVEGELCFLKGVVSGQLGSEVKLIGCLPETDRHEDDQMTIILKAGSDSGWYSVYYATPQDDFVTVKKIRNKNNVSGKPLYFSFEEIICHNRHKIIKHDLFFKLFYFSNQS